MFYRPAALKAPLGELATPWQSQLVMEKQGERWRITNPSAYYITLVEARRAENTPGTGKAGSGQAATREKPGTGGKQGGAKPMDVAAFTPLMLAPGDSAVLPGSAADYGRAPVFTYLNDYGGRPEITFQCDTQRCRVTANRVPPQ